jgi:long-chain acyl-CoA synthetase
MTCSFSNSVSEGRNTVDIPHTEPLQSILSQDQFRYPGNLGGLLDRIVELGSSRIGIAIPNHLVTFSTYYDQVCRIVQGLKKIGLERNDKVLFISHNSLNYAFISLAVFRIGAVLVPINPRIRHYEMAHIASETRPKFVICQRNNIPTTMRAFELLKERQLPRIISIDERDPSAIFFGDLDLTRGESLFESMEPDATAMVVYTAAMDGYPLGAKLTHASVFYDTAFVADLLYNEDGVEREVAASILPLFHTYGFTAGILAPLAGGVTSLLLNTSMGGRRLVDVMEAYHVTQIFSVPAIFFSIMKPLSAHPGFLSRLKNLTSGGIKMPMSLLEKYRDLLGLTISEGYGLTEASPVVTWNRINRPTKFGTVGCPLGCCQVKIVDDKGKELPQGHEGEVLVRGLNLFSGYLDQEEHTSKAFLNGWLRTGDLGSLDEENYLILTGLKKDMINIFGLKVYPKEVERILLHHPDIKSARIWGEWDEKYGNVVASEIVLKPGRGMSVSEFQNWCRDNISPYKIPRKIRVRD